MLRRSFVAVRMNMLLNVYPRYQPVRSFNYCCIGEGHLLFKRVFVQTQRLCPLFRRRPASNHKGDHLPQQADPHDPCEHQSKSTIPSFHSVPCYAFALTVQLSRLSESFFALDFSRELRNFRPHIALMRAFDNDRRSEGSAGSRRCHGPSGGGQPGCARGTCERLILI